MSSFVLQITLHEYLESYNIFADSMFDLSTSPANISLRPTLIWSFHSSPKSWNHQYPNVKFFFNYLSVKKWGMIGTYTLKVNSDIALS